MAGSPIGKVLQLLTSLSAKIVKEGQSKQEIYEQFADECQVNAINLQHSIKSAKDKIGRLEAAIGAAKSDIEVASSNIEKVSEGFSKNEADLKQATKVRKDEQAVYEAENAELNEIIDTLVRAQQIVQKHFMKDSSFLQSDQQMLEGVTFAMQNLLAATALSTEDATTVSNLLQTIADKDDDDDSQKTIMQTLADLQEKAEEQRAKSQRKEQKARSEFALFKQALDSDMSTQKRQLDEAKKQKAGAEEQLATDSGELEGTQKDKKADEGVLKDLKMECMGKASEYETEQKERNAELKALAAAKKIIQESTGGADEKEYSFVQMRMTMKLGAQLQRHYRAASVIEGLGQQSNDFGLMQLAIKIRGALKGGAGGPFDKVKGMIQAMLDKLVEEEQKESGQKAFCDKEIGETTSSMKKLESRQAQLGSRIEQAKALVTKVTSDIRTLQKETGRLLEMQQEADAMRQKEHITFLEAKKDYEDGVEGVKLALKVLREYYAQSDDDSFIQAQTTFKLKKADASGIIGMLEVTEADFSRSLADINSAEEEAQSEYEKETQENRVARAEKEQNVKGLERTKAETEKHIADTESDLDSVDDEFHAVKEYMDKLTPQCTAKAPTYEERARRRQKEIEGLQNALAILAGEAIGGEDFMQQAATAIKVSDYQG